MPNSPTSTKRTLILITGYARAGKDTLADGIVEGARHNVLRFNFADALKQKCDFFLESLEIGGSDSLNSFYNDDFKVKNRQMLVVAGTLARSLDPDVFAKALVRRCQIQENNCDELNEPCTVVCSDWRYSNEYFVPMLLLGIWGWDIYTVSVDTIGVTPACEEEGKSIGGILRECPVNIAFTFAPNNPQIVRAEGMHLARTLAI